MCMLVNAKGALWASCFKDIEHLFPSLMTWREEADAGFWVTGTIRSCKKIRVTISNCGYSEDFGREVSEIVDELESLGFSDIRGTVDIHDDSNLVDVETFIIDDGRVLCHNGALHMVRAYGV